MISTQTLPTIAIPAASSAVSGAPPGGGEDLFAGLIQLFATIATSGSGGDVRQVPSTIGKDLPDFAELADLASERVTRPAAPTSPVPGPAATLATFLARATRKPPPPSDVAPDVVPAQSQATEHESDGETAADATRPTIPVPVPVPVLDPGTTLVRSQPDTPVSHGGGSEARALDAGNGLSAPAIQSPTVADKPIRHTATGSSRDQPSAAAAPAKDLVDATLPLSKIVDFAPAPLRAKEAAIEMATAGIVSPTDGVSEPPQVSLAPDARINWGGGTGPSSIDIENGSPAPGIRSPAIEHEPVRHPPTGVAGDQPLAATPAKISADPTTPLSRAVDVSPVQARAKDEAIDVVAAHEGGSIPFRNPTSTPIPAPMPASPSTPTPAPPFVPALVPLAPDARITGGERSEPRDAGVRIGSASPGMLYPAIVSDPALATPVVEIAAITAPPLAPAPVPALVPAPMPTPTATPAPVAVTIAPMTRDPQPPQNTAEGNALVPGSRMIAAAPMPPIVAPEPGARGSAGQVFAAAIHIASRDETPTSRTIDFPTPITTTPITTLQPALDLMTLAVATIGDTGRAPLDLRQGDWPARMIDRIETLRDAADALDTRIRVVPDALGTVDVSLRREGDTVHVQFSAEQAETRALLGEAQPKLAELAESRGLKLAQGSVGDGTGQQPQRQPRTTPVTPVVPRHALTETPDTDHRLA